MSLNPNHSDGDPVHNPDAYTTPGDFPELLPPVTINAHIFNLSKGLLAGDENALYQEVEYTKEKMALMTIKKDVDTGLLTVKFTTGEAPGDFECEHIIDPETGVILVSDFTSWGRGEAVYMPEIHKFLWGSYTDMTPRTGALDSLAMGFDFKFTKLENPDDKKPTERSMHIEQSIDENGVARLNVDTECNQDAYVKGRHIKNLHIKNRYVVQPALYDKGGNVDEEEILPGIKRVTANSMIQGVDSDAITLVWDCDARGTQNEIPLIELLNMAAAKARERMYAAFPEIKGRRPPLDP